MNDGDKVRVHQTYQQYNQHQDCHLYLKTLPLMKTQRGVSLMKQNTPVFSEGLVDRVPSLLVLCCCPNEMMCLS